MLYLLFFFLRFGRMMCIRSLRALEAHEEVFVDYNYRVWQAPAWYQEQWIQYKRDTENVSEVKNTTLPNNENTDMAVGNGTLSR